MRVPHCESIDLAAAALADQRHHMLGLSGTCGLEPFLEEAAELQRQAQQDSAGVAARPPRPPPRGCARVRMSLSAGIIGEASTATGMPAWLSAAMVSRRRSGVAARGSILRASLRSSVVTDTATAASRSAAIGARKSMSRWTSADLVTMHRGCWNSRSTSRMRRVRLELALGRLIGIGVGAERDRLAAIARPRQFRRQQRRRVLLDEDAALEVEAGRQAEIGVRRPREAIDAAMLAAAIGVDRAVERNVGGIVARDDGLGAVARQDRVERMRRRVLAAPAVIDPDLDLRLEPPGRIAEGAAALARPIGKHLVHAPDMTSALEQIKNYSPGDGRVAQAPAVRCS